VPRLAGDVAFDGTVTEMTPPLLAGTASCTVLTGVLPGHNHGFACTWVTKLIARSAAKSTLVRLSFMSAAFLCCQSVGTTVFPIIRISGRYVQAFVSNTRRVESPDGRFGLGKSRSAAILLGAVAQHPCGGQYSY